MSSTTNDNTQLVESNEPSLDGVALLAAAEQGQLTAMNALTFGAVAKAAALTFGAVAKAAALTFGACATRGESAAASVVHRRELVEVEEVKEDLRATTPCRNGLQCHGRNGSCAFQHPERPDCKNGWDCHGRATGKCPFSHHECEVAPTQLALLPPPVRVTYARFVSETADLRMSGDVYSEATWALLYEQDFAVLLAYSLVPPLSILAPEDDGKSAAASVQDFCLEDLDFFESPVKVANKKTVTFGARTYRSVDHGSRAGGHSNMCFYLSAAAGNHEAAVALKDRLTPLADHISRTFGLLGTFTALDAPADIEVVLAYVATTKIPICIASLETGKSFSVRPRGDSVGDTVYLQLAREHYTRLVFP